MHLFDADDRQLATVVTDESGHYSFVGLVGGTYSVCYQPSTLPGGLVSTIAGADPRRDSDVVDTACTAPVALATAGTLTNLDLGLAAATVDLSVTLSGAWSAASGEIEWSIVVRNGGIDAEPGPVVVNDILPTGLGVPTITAPDGMACTFDADTRALVCTTSSPLAANASFTLGVVTPRTNLEVCEISNTLSVRGTAIDATTANNVATATVPLPCATAAPTTPAPTTPSLPSTGGRAGPRQPSRRSSPSRATTSSEPATALYR
ncbi:MAG: SdrD B-like domain-containing protein [Acidimicrobiales bacterium]